MAKSGEIAYLRREEVHLRTPHPYARLLDVSTDEDDSWIFGIRNKTGAFGQWRLWPVTVRLFGPVSRGRRTA